VRQAAPDLLSPTRGAVPEVGPQGGRGWGMTVGDLQRYFRGLAEALGAAKAATAVKELNDVADRLAPYAALPGSEFVQFLALAWEYKTTGKIPEPGARPGRGRVIADGSGKAPPKPDPAEAIVRLKLLYDRALDPSVTRELVEREVKSLD